MLRMLFIPFNLSRKTTSLRSSVSLLRSPARWTRCRLLWSLAALKCFPVISRILTLSLSYGHLSEEWTETLVTPSNKKPGLDPTQLNNLRPVSNLDFISKLTERAVFDQIHSHMSRFVLYPTSQSAYRKGHSTETALLKVQNDIS